METSVVGLLLAIMTAIPTYLGLRDRSFQENYLFSTDGILMHKEYFRMFSSGFLHGNWLHYAFNMVALVSFSETLELFLGVGNTLVVYFGSLLGGSLLALYFHRNHGDYKAVGASGAVSGIVMAYIVLFPDGGIGFPGTEISIKAWIFGPLYVLLSIIGIKYSIGNIGHDAHLGGAIVGALLAAAYRPEIALENWWVLLLIIVPCALFLALLARNPNMMLIPNDWGKEVQSLQHYQKKINRKEEIDRILDKINRKGIDSLTIAERRLLEENEDNG